MKLRLLPFLGLLLFSSALVSCSDDEIATPDTSSSKMIRTFNYTNPVSVEQIKYTRDSLSTIAILDEDELMFIVTTEGSTDMDDLSLALDRELLTGTTQDSYNVESVANNGTGDVRVIYAFDAPNNSGSIYISSVDNMNGQLRITNFNAQDKLISGNYDITIPDVYDPEATTHTSGRRATIRITGEFKDLKIVE